MAGASGLTGPVGALLRDVGEIPPAAEYVVATSGGADSAVAAWLTVTLAAAPVRAVYVDHGLPDSAMLGAAAAAVAQAIGIELETVTIDVPPGGNWEARARLARRTALEQAAPPGALIVTGHHRDDQVETIVANLARGAGATGLSGMRPRRGRWYRPLLAVPRATVRIVARRLGLPFADDPANDDAAPARNRLRHEVLPVLDEVLPGMRDGIARSGRHLAADDELLHSMAELGAVTRARDAWLVPVPLVATLPLPLRNRLLREAVRAARPPHPPSTAELERLWDVAAGTAPATELAGGLVAVREGPYLTLHRRAAPMPAPPGTLDVPGSLRWAEWNLEAVRPQRRPPRVRRDEAMLDAAAVRGALLIRPVDRSEPIDIGTGTKRAGDALAEAGVPRRLRADWPAASVDGKIAWLVGVRVAHWCRPTGEASDVIVVRARRS